MGTNSTFFQILHANIDKALYYIMLCYVGYLDEKNHRVPTKSTMYINHYTVNVLNLLFAPSVAIYPRGWGYSTNIYTGRLRPEVQPLTLFKTIFCAKGTPFLYLLLTDSTPLTYLVQFFASLLTVVNPLSFTQESKIECFL